MTDPITVLLVEDELLIRMEIAEELSDRGFEVLEASNSQEAIALLSRHSNIRLMFTDIDMPGQMDGLMLATATRDRWPQIKIIVTSGIRNVDMDQLPLESRFLRKPYLADSIASAMFEMVA